MAYEGKAKSLSRTYSQSLSLSFTVKFVSSFGFRNKWFFFFLLNELSYLGMDDKFRRCRVGYEHALLLPCGTPVLMNLQTLTQLISQHLDTNSLRPCLQLAVFTVFCSGTFAFQCLFMLSWHVLVNSIFWAIRFILWDVLVFLLVIWSRSPPLPPPPCISQDDLLI